MNWWSNMSQRRFQPESLQLNLFTTWFLWKKKKTFISSASKKKILQMRQILRRKRSDQLAHNSQIDSVFLQLSESNKKKTDKWETMQSDVMKRLRVFLLCVYLHLCTFSAMLLRTDVSLLSFKWTVILLFITAGYQTHYREI